VTATRDPNLQPRLQCVSAHRWSVVSPDGSAVLPATCKYCGAQRTYKPWLDDGWKISQSANNKKRKKGRAIVL
jgi:hypothetical protein